MTLPSGGVLVSFGVDQNGQLNDTQQVGENGQWRDIVNFNGPPLYPRMHVVSDGRAFMSGPLALTQFLDTAGGGNWTPLSDRLNQFRDYAPAVMYEADKILYVGGGSAPTKAAEVDDLGGAMPQWRKTDDMHFARRQHNATLLPDGTVLVMGGTLGNDGVSGGFNDLAPGQPIRSAELWDPKTGHGAKLARASVDRCDHSVAVLLPEATVLSAGGGEYRPRNDVDQPNRPEDSHKDARVFSPPYLFRSDGGRADRPDITDAPTEVAYGQTFTVMSSHPDPVGRVSWVRLSSVTHSFHMNQRINFLTFAAAPGGLAVTAPANANLCPPGHYMLIVLNNGGVPSEARIIRVH